MIQAVSATDLWRFTFVEKILIQTSTIRGSESCILTEGPKGGNQMGTGAYSREEIAALYERHFPMVYQICLLLLRQVADAEDAAQTVFRKMMERETPFRDPEHEKAWLIVTARNECRDQLRHWWRTRRADSSVLDTLVWEQPQDWQIWEQVATLPEKHRLVLYLHYYQGYRTGEIAEMLGENPSTVRSRLVQARRKLKIRLEEDGYEPL